MSGSGRCGEALGLAATGRDDLREKMKGVKGTKSLEEEGRGREGEAEEWGGCRRTAGWCPTLGSIRRGGEGEGFLTAARLLRNAPVLFQESFHLMMDPLI